MVEREPLGQPYNEYRPPLVRISLGRGQDCHPPANASSLFYALTPLHISASDVWALGERHDSGLYTIVKRFESLSFICICHFRLFSFGLEAHRLLIPILAKLGFSMPSKLFSPSMTCHVMFQCDRSSRTPLRGTVSAVSELLSIFHRSIPEDAYRSRYIDFGTTLHACGNQALDRGYSCQGR